MSFAPPAGNGTTTLIGRCGNGWAKQEPANTGMAQTAMNADRAMREWTMNLSFPGKFMGRIAMRLRIEAMDTF